MKNAWILIAALLLSGCGTASSTPGNTAADTDAAAAGQPAEQGGAEDEVTLKILSYDEILQLIKSHRGKVVVMDAWSTSCEPCIKEFPNLVALSRKYPDRVAAISLSFDYEGIGTPEEVRPVVLEFLRAQGATFDNVLSNEESDVLYRKFDLASIPAVFVYNQHGELVRRFDNDQAGEEGFSYRQVEALVEQLLNDPPAEASGE